MSQVIQKRPVTAHPQVSPPQPGEGRRNPVLEAERLAKGKTTLMDGIYSREELCEILGISSRALYDYDARGMPFLKFGWKRMYDIAAVREWILSHKRDRTPRGRGRPRK